MEKQKGTLIIHPSKEAIPATLHSLIQQSFLRAINSSTSFYIAVSGGSLPSFLVTLPQSFIDAKIDPQWDKWHVLLADERLVPSTHEDSNLGALMKTFLDSVPIPKEQIYGIDEKMLTVNENDAYDADSIDPDAMASEYQSRVFDPLLSDHDRKPFLVDCALLGFGPDGHTCSLFPGHELLNLNKNENNLLVAGIADSPKMPPKRITLTLKTLNEFTRDIIFVGAGESKCDVLNSIFDTTYLSKICDRGAVGSEMEINKYDVIMNNASIFPCGMLRPVSNSLCYVTDIHATKNLPINNRFTCAML